MLIVVYERKKQSPNFFISIIKVKLNIGWCHKEYEQERNWINKKRFIS